jgi:hypothetical protein
MVTIIVVVVSINILYVGEPYLKTITIVYAPRKHLKTFLMTSENLKTGSDLNFVKYRNTSPIGKSVLADGTTP